MSSKKHSFNFPDSGAHVPEDKNQFLVQTPYGRGMVIRTRKKKDGSVQMRELELLDWKRPESGDAAKGLNRPATLFSPLDFPSVEPQVDDEVLTIYGRGRVTELRSAMNQVVVRLSSWRLAGRSLVYCYLSKAAVQVVRPKKIYEMSVYEKVEKAQDLKQEAARQFATKDYKGALQTYAHAIDTVRYVQHKPDSSNEVRADLLVVMVTCTNNAATCCTKLQQWDEAIKFAKNALVLIDAMDEKRGKRIHSILTRDGFSDVKLFGEWRVKSHLVMARALASKHDHDEAMECLKKAHDVIVKYSSEEYAKEPSLKASVQHLLSLDKEVKKLNTACRERRKAEKKKEKQRAQAMFGAPSRDVVDEEKKDIAEPSLVAENDTSRDAKKPIETTEKVLETARADANPDIAAPKPLKSKKARKVSFADEEKHELPSDSNDDPEWYKDPEVLTGLAIFGGVAIGTGLVLNYFLSGRRR